jgi:hypothetical protein
MHVEAKRQGRAMSLLYQQSPEAKEDPASGESYTRGTSQVVVATIVAAVLVTIAVAIYVIAGEKPPAAVGEILDIWAHPMHTETSGFDASGAPMPKESYDQVLVFTHVRLRNQSKQSIFLHQVTANILLDDGIHSSYAAMPSDYERIFKAYPALGQWQATPMSPETTLQPGETKEGTFVCAFRMPKAQWDARKSLDFTFGFEYLPNLKVVPKVSVTEH